MIHKTSERHVRAALLRNHASRGQRFVVRPSGGSLYFHFDAITNFRLKAELRTKHMLAVSSRYRLVQTSMVTPWPPLIGAEEFRFRLRGGHGGPPLHVFPATRQSCHVRDALPTQAELPTPD